MATQYTAGLTTGQVLTAATMNSIGATWETYSPTVSSQTGALTSWSVGARYARIQKIVIVRFQISISDKGTGNGALFMTVPFAADITFGSACGSFSEWTNVGFTGTTNLLNDAGKFTLLKYDWTSPIVNGTFSGFAIYEAA
jgi:hypothetical protein